MTFEKKPFKSIVVKGENAGSMDFKLGIYGRKPEVLL